MEIMIAVAQGVSVTFLAAWLTIGALENLLHPYLNETYTAEVMDMARMREEYPEAYVHVAHRRVTSARLRQRLFMLIVVWELATAAALWAGAGALLLSAVGVVGVGLALGLALTAVLMFNATWAGFLIAGNWFCYWFGHEGGQNTHFHMLAWGGATLLILLAGAAALR